jgi:ornithine--oxo-acid transaminase
MVLKAAPPLLVTEAQIITFVEAIERVVDEVHSSTAFWSDALGLVRRTANI